MKQIKARIVQNKKVAHGFYNMRIETPYLAKNIKPGQFIEVKCSGGSEVLLRRPLGCHRVLKNGIEMLYEVVGKGTELLSQKKKGEMLDAIGPLGNGFDIRPKAKNHRHVLVAGGIGVAPLLALAERLSHREKIYVLIGACKKSHLLCESDFKKLGAEVSVTTEDGSKGRKGLVTELLSNFLSITHDWQPAIIYACGPNAMLKEIAYIAKAKRMPCQVSLEEHMACGVGACLGCPVKVKSSYVMRGTQYEYKMVCKDGPVFNAEEIAW